MYLRQTQRRKNGKLHTYYSVAETRRVQSGPPVQRQVLYLGEISATQEQAWRKALLIFDEDAGDAETLPLLAEESEVSAAELRAVRIRVDRMELHRARSYGDCWLACWLWGQLELDRFWQPRLAAERGAVPWVKVLRLLVVHRLLAPGSEFRLHRQWFERSAMDELLGVDYAVAAKDRLYRCLDLLLPHREALFQHLKQRWTDLFSAGFDVLLYDLTSTYFEGLCEEIPKARHGYSRDGRPDCRQVVIALIVTPDGLPLAYEVLPGNTADCTTLRPFLAEIERRYGKARRVWVMDRGIPTEDVLAEMRAQGVFYLVGTPKGKLSALEKSFLDRPWQEVHAGLEVRLLPTAGELWIWTKSADRRQKEQAMRRRRLRRYWAGLEALRRQPHLTRDRLLERLGVLKRDAGRSAALLTVRVPAAAEPLTPETFYWRVEREKLRQVRRREGQYLLRTNLSDQAPEELWAKYMQLTHVEAAFKCLKSDLRLRPIYHQVAPRVEAHILVAFLAYSLMATLRKRLEVLAPGLTPKAVLEKLAEIQMVDVVFPTADRRQLIMPRYTQPEKDQQLLLQRLQLVLPGQPPPRIRSPHPLPPTAICSEDSPPTLLDK